MYSLPVELQIDLIALAAHVLGLLDVSPSPDDLFFPDDDADSEALDTLIRCLRQSLPTRRALPFVSRTFNAIATPSSTSVHILLNQESSPRLRVSLNPPHAALVRHVTIDFSLHIRTFFDHNLAHISSFLNNVHILSLRGTVQGQLVRAPDAFLDSNHTRAMDPWRRPSVPFCVGSSSVAGPDSSSSPTPLLRSHFPSPVWKPSSHPNHTSRSNLPCSPPLSLPLIPEHRRNALQPSIDTAPTHVRLSTSTITPFILSPSLTHLALFLTKNANLDIYAPLADKTPNLNPLTLTLSIFLPDITRFFALCHPGPLPPRLYRHQAAARERVRERLGS